MGAHELLRRLHREGFSVAADAGQLLVAPASRLDDTARASIREHKAGLLALLQAPPRPMEPATLAANDPASTYPGPDALTARRLARLASLGWDEARAENMAERLAQRDLMHDDRRCCVECSHLGNAGRCLAAAAGRLLHTDRRHVPVLDLLQRCEGFGLRKGMQ